ALGRRRPGGGRHGKYLLSGLLKCGKCRASWVLSNGARYQCASHHEGGKAACDVSLSLRRDLAERIILDCVETDLLDPAKLSALEARLRAVVSRPAPNYDKRIAELTREIENLADAIAKVGLSEALAERLKVAERERSHMIAAQGAGRSEPRALPQATIEHRVAIMRQRLAGGGEAARQALREIFPQALVITIDGGRLFAEFPELVMMPDGELVGVRAALFDGYLTQPGEFEDVRPEVENSGSGGRI
ncbi:MAG TPA: zinc ribbon domain-containing protein, partial [Steroidobacteraceae bacterium]|nr:zinc ribbon domain-containing protein [Steroidobacteraceae bacterium]